MASNNSESPDALRDGFVDPDDAYGPVPLWWWDGEDLDDARLTDQLERLRDNGVPSVCFISKFPDGESGDTRRYFGEEWWDRLEHVARECRRLGMELWVHDETYHHSPPNHRKYWQHRIEVEAGENPAYRGTALRRVATDVTDGATAVLDLPDEFTSLSVAAYPRREDGTLDLSRTDTIDVDAAAGRVEWSAPDSGSWHVAAIGREPAGLCYTTPDVVERYVDCHFEEYVRRLGPDLVEDALAGTFEDELLLFQPEYPHDRTVNVPAGEHVLDRFESEYGADPRPRLVGLYEDVGDETPRIRSRYYDVVTTLVEENWFEPLFEWHEDHDLRRSHDNFGRLSLSKQTIQYGDYFRTMRWYQAPGYDDGNIDPKAIETVPNIPIGERNFFDAKLAASIAACYDRDRVWGELFHSTGWGFTPEKQLAGIAENVCYGMTLYDKHGCYYTTLGGWWEHAPPDTHFRQPYWDHVGALNDAATRLSYLFSRGSPVVDAAVLYPATSMHVAWRPDEGIDAAGERIDDDTRELAASLYESGSDLLFVDQNTLADAEITDGALDVAGTQIPALVLGPTTTIRRETAAAMRRLYRAGGVVVATGALPVATAEGGRGDEFLADVLQEVLGGTDLEESDGDGAVGTDYPDSDAATLVAENAAGGVGLAVGSIPERAGDLLGQYVQRDVRHDVDGLYHTHRSVGDRDVYLLLNTEERAREATVRLRGEKRPYRWDALSGDVEPIQEYAHESGDTRLDLSFEPYEFHVVVLEPPTGDPRALETMVDEVTTAEKSTVGDGSDADAERIALDGEWMVEPVPELDNEWGDFRYPASEAVIGPEIRRFQYSRDRPGADPTADQWRAVRWSHGPYFWRKSGVKGDVGPVPSSDDPDGWDQYRFSKATGYPYAHPNHTGLIGTTGEDFLVSPDGNGRTCFWTTLRATEGGTVRCHYGPEIERIEIGARTIDPTGAESAVHSVSM
jgi:hypothetical protein